jgi:HK97 family phage portal protein
MLSYWCSGNVYFRKVRNGLARTIELMWLPHWEVKPCRLPGSGNWVDHYEWRVQGAAKAEIIPASEVVHLRAGVDPRNPLCGISPLRGLLLSVFNDAEVNRFAAALMQNLGLPGAIYRHKPQEIVGADGQTRELIGLGQEQAERIKVRHREVFSGERIGDTQILDGNWEAPLFPDMKIDTAFIEKTKDISESAIANAFNLPASLLGFLVGMKHGNTRASHEDARRQGYQEGLVPLQSSIASDYDLALMPEFGLDASRYYLAYDYSSVSVMGDDLLACARRASILYTGGLATQNEGRSIANLPAVPGGDVFHVKPTASADKDASDTDKDDPMPEPRDT